MINTNEASRVRHRAVDEGGQLQTLINSLTLDQLRFGLSKLAPAKKLSIRKHTDALDSFIKTGKSIDAILQELLFIEASTPAKHCLVNSCGSGVLALLETAEETITHAGFTFHIAYSADYEDCTLITFEHLVPVKLWVEESTDVRRRKSVEIRHPIVLRYLKGAEAAMFYYPGFSQGDGVQRNEKIAYETVLQALTEGLKQQFGVVFGLLPVEAAIGLLANGHNNRVKVIRSDVEGSTGRIGVTARTSTSNLYSVEDVITNFVMPHLAGVDKTTLRSAVATAFSGAPANSLVVHWIEEGILTRLNFWPIGAEFYFVWHGASQTNFVVDRVISLLFDVAKQVAAPSGKEAWGYLSGLQPGTVILPNNFAANFSIEPADAARLFVKAVQAGVLKAVYRVKTEESLMESVNDWTEALSKLRQTFLTTSGSKIDGTAPENIEVAFERVSDRKERS